MRNTRENQRQTAFCSRSLQYEPKPKVFRDQVRAGAAHQAASLGMKILMLADAATFCKQNQ